MKNLYEKLEWKNDLKAWGEIMGYLIISSLVLLGSLVVLKATGIIKGEYQKDAIKIFKRADTNKDFVLDSTEFIRYYEKIK